MKPKLYIETTIPSYLVARPSRDLVVAGHQQLTCDWWASRRTDFEIFLSQFVLDEAGLGDPEMARKRLQVMADLAQLEVSEEVGTLAEKLVRSGAIPQKASARRRTHRHRSRTRNGLPADVELHAHCQR